LEEAESISNKKEWANINIKVTKEIKDELDKIKLHPREPYHEVIYDLIQIYLAFAEIKKEGEESKGVITEELEKKMVNIYRFVEGMIR